VHTGPYSDVYALGAALYHLLTGQAPATATDRLLPAPMTKPLTPPRQLNPAISSRVEQALIKALELAPASRFDSVREMQRALLGQTSPQRVVPVGLAAGMGGVLLLVIVALFLAPTTSPPTNPALTTLAPTIPTPGAGTPSVSLEPAFGPPGTTVNVRGQGWQRGQAMLIYLMAPGQSEVPSFAAAGSTANEEGRFSARVVIPAEPEWQTPGQAAVIARVAEEGTSARVAFDVVSGTPGAPLATAPATGEPSPTPTEVPPTLTPTPTAGPNMPRATPTGLETATPTLFSRPTPTPAPTAITDDFGVSMNLVSAGPFIMGSDPDQDLLECQTLYDEHAQDCQRGWFEDNGPVHSVALDAFYIDRYEVTNAQYAACVAAGECTLPTVASSSTRSSCYGNPMYDNYPVINVSWEQAAGYCTWRRARLLTEAEWEKAARGADGQRFPWGNSFDGNRVNFCDQNCPNQGYANRTYNDGYADTAQVGSYPAGISVYGVHDLIGNVFEWVADWYDAGYYAVSPSQNPLGPSSGTLRIVRGNSWYSTIIVGAADRVAVGINDLAYLSDKTGFRCAK
jgi:formylglycine-generating enzyme required for sulfatase activity